MVIILLSGSFGGRACGEEAALEELKNLYARSAVLLDADSGRVLFGKEENVPRPMASTTKIMTCILALENADEEEIVGISDDAASQPQVRLGVRKDENYYLKDLLYSLMLESHNDSAVAIAEHVAGSVEAFAEMMNRKALDLGCKDTHFVTPNGLDARDEKGVHSTTARDLAVIMKYCIRGSEKKERFLEITRTRSYTFSDVDGKRQFSCSNHNAFLGMMEGALSGKTGFTGDAGYCYVGALESEGRTFVVALLACGWPNNKGYKWSDTRKLMSYGMENYHYRTLRTGLSDTYIEVKDGIPENGRVNEKAYVEISVPEEEWQALLKDTEEIKEYSEWKESLDAPVKKGEKVGSIRYFLGDTVIKSVEVKTCKSVYERTFKWCLAQVGKCFTLFAD